MSTFTLELTEEELEYLKATMGMRLQLVINNSQHPNASVADQWKPEREPTERLYGKICGLSNEARLEREANIAKAVFGKAKTEAELAYWKEIKAVAAQQRHVFHGQFAEFGLFNDEGLVEGGFDDWDKAVDHIGDCYSWEDGLYVAQICPDHENEEHGKCEQCNE